MKKIEEKALKLSLEEFDEILEEV
jgi:hypothetical protein